MFNKFNEKMDDLYQVTNGKNVILWGWGMSGKFLYLHFKKSNRRIACVIDDGFNNEMDIIGIKSHHVLDYYEPETTTILVTVYKGTEEIEEICHQYGFRDVILIRHMFYEDEPSRELDYYPWLEYEYGMDLVHGKTIAEAEHGEPDCNVTEFHDYWPGKGIVLESVLNNFKFHEDDAVFDFGCGKGTSFFIFERAGMKRGGGIEFDRQLYRLAAENADILERETGHRYSVVCGDAAKFTDIDSYNYFYMFDPFEGECLQNVITNIENSYRRKNRKIILIYMAPRFHRQVVENQMFKLAYEVKSLFAITRTTNVYVLG